MRISVVEAALRYARRGWQVVPVRGKLPLTAHAYKDGSVDPDQIRRWWEEHPGAGVGIVVGEASGLCVLDVDPRAGGDESLRHLTEEHGPLPETPTVSTAGGGQHLYFRYHEQAARSTIAPGLELKARDGYVVAPPSRNLKTGRAYVWTLGKGVNLADLPRWLLSEQGIVAKETAALTDGPIPEGERNSVLTSIAGRLRKQGESKDGIRAALEAVNRVRCQPPLSDDEVETIARSVARYPAGTSLSAKVTKPGWPTALDAAAYHGLAGEFVSMVKPHTESDPAALLSQFLIGVGNVIGRSAFFAVESDLHYTNEFALMVGETSRARKGTSSGNARRPLAAVDPDWAHQRQQGGLSSGEGLIWAVRDPIVVRSAIRQKGRVIDYEDVQEDPGIADKRLLVLEPEFASTLRVMGRDGSTLSAVVRQAWDTGDLRVMTKKSPARASGAHVSIIGHVTAEELLRYLDRTEAANGFINRFLILCVRRARLLPEGGRIHEVDFRSFHERLARAVAWARGRSAVPRDDAARSLWHEVYPDLSGGVPGLLGAVISRAEAHVVRLSLLYALLDGVDRIGRPHLEAALALWRYAEASARYIFGDALGDPVADELLGALRGQPNGMTRTEISTHFGRHRRAEEMARALTALLERGLARVEREQTSGRAAERWYATSGAKEAKYAQEGAALPDPVSLGSHSSQAVADAGAETTPPDSHNSLPSQSTMAVDVAPAIGSQPVQADILPLDRFMASALGQADAAGSAE